MFGKELFRVWEPCKPLKSHKTAKGIFGKARRKLAEIWKSLQKSLEARRATGSAANPPRPPQITVTLYLTAPAAHPIVDGARSIRGLSK